MLKIALTGPSGSGKGYVSSLLSEKTGRPVPVCVNADEAVEAARRLIG